MGRLFPSVAALLLAAGVAAGDVVHLRNGGRVEGTVVEADNLVEIDTGYGVVRFEKALVARIEKKPFQPPRNAPPRSFRRTRLGPSYAHPFYAFKIQLPPGWKRDAEASGQAAASFTGPPDDAYIPRMDLFIEKSPDALPDHVSRIRGGLQKSIPGISFDFDVPLTISGGDAHQICGSFSEGDPAVGRRTLWTFVAAGDDRKYILTFTCTQAWFGRFFDKVDASMKSLRLYPLPTADSAAKARFMEHYTRAEKAYREDRLEDALADFKLAADLVPEFAEIHGTVGTLCLKLDKLDEAEAAYRRALERDPSDPLVPYNLGLCLLQQNKSKEALAMLKKAATLNPSWEPGLTNLGAAYLQEGLDEPARETLQKAVEADPESAAAHHNLGLALERLGRFSDARREFKEALKIDPAHGGARAAMERLTGR